MNKTLATITVVTKGVMLIQITCSVLAIVFNVLLLRRFWLSKIPRPINKIIAVICVSDIVMAGFTLPLQMHYSIFETWIWGYWGCKLIPGLCGVPLFLSTYGMLFIAVYRRVCVLPRGNIPSNIFAVYFIVVVIFAIVVALPLFVFSCIGDCPTKGIPDDHCLDLEWPGRYSDYITAYLTCVLILQLLLPLTCTAALNFSIFLILRSRVEIRKRHGMSAPKGHKKTILILTTMVVMMCMSWLPLNIMNLLWQSEVLADPEASLNLFIKLATISSGVTNPLLFGLFGSPKKDLGKTTPTQRLLQSIKTRCGNLNGLRSPKTPTVGTRMTSGSSRKPKHLLSVGDENTPNMSECCDPLFQPEVELMASNALRLTNRRRSESGSLPTRPISAEMERVCEKTAYARFSLKLVQTDSFDV